MTVVVPVPETRWAWREHAACQGAPLQLFFTGHDTPDPAALDLCSWCVVRPDCLESALAEERGLTLHFRHGIRGGTTPRERAEMDGMPVPERVSRPRLARRERAPKAPRTAVPRTHCQRGHELTTENVKVETDGRRACRTCRAARQRARRARAAGERVAA